MLPFQWGSDVRQWRSSSTFADCSARSCSSAGRIGRSLAAVLPYSAWAACTLRREKRFRRAAQTSTRGNRSASKNNRTLHASTYGSGRSCARSRVRLLVEKSLISVRKVAPFDHTRRSSKLVLPECRTDTDRDHQQSHDDIEYHALQTKRNGRSRLAPGETYQLI